MAKVIVTFKVMPDNPDSDLEDIKSKLKDAIANFGGTINGVMSEEPVAFGLNAVKVSFSYDENKGTTDDLEEALTKEDEIQSVEVVSVGRAMG